MIGHFQNKVTIFKCKYAREPRALLVCRAIIVIDRPASIVLGVSSRGLASKSPIIYILTLGYYYGGWKIEKRLSSGRPTSTLVYAKCSRAVFCLSPADGFRSALFARAPTHRPCGCRMNITMMTANSAWTESPTTTNKILETRSCHCKPFLYTYICILIYHLKRPARNLQNQCQL